MELLGKVMKIKNYKKEIRKIVFDKFGKTQAKLDGSFNTNLTRNVGKVEVKLERNFEENLNRKEEIFRKFREIHDACHCDRPNRWKTWCCQTDGNFTEI